MALLQVLELNVPNRFPDVAFLNYKDRKRIMVSRRAVAFLNYKDRKRIMVSRRAVPN